MDLVEYIFQNAAEVLPGLPAAEIEAIRRPAAIASLLPRVSGFEGAHRELVDLTGREYSFGLEPFSQALPLSTDGCGNYWLIDDADVSGNRIFFACHDPPVLVFQFRTLEDFVQAALDKRCQLDQVSSDLAQRIWDREPGLAPSPVRATHARGSEDRQLREFAASLPAEHAICDLRELPFPSGFAFGADAIVRWEDSMLFALGPAEEPPTMSLGRSVVAWAKALFGIRPLA